MLMKDGVVKITTIAGDLDKISIDTSSSQISSVKLNNVSYKFSAFPLYSFSDEKIADLLIAIDTEDLQTAVDKISLILVLFAIGGFVVSLVIAWSFAGKISTPIRELALMSNQLASGNFDVDIASAGKDEIGELVNSFNEMAVDLKDYHQRLIDNERMAAFTQMAQKVAHEIKNPLTPIQVSIQDMARSYNRKDKDFPDILENSCNTVLDEVSALKTARETNNETA